VTKETQHIYVLIASLKWLWDSMVGCISLFQSPKFSWVVRTRGHYFKVTTQNPFSAGAPQWIPLAELMMLPQTSW